MNSFLKTKEHLRDCLAPYSTLSSDFTPIIMTQPCCLSCALYQKWHLISSCTWCGLVFTIALWAHSVLTTMKCDPDGVEVWMRECLPFSGGGGSWSRDEGWWVFILTWMMNKLISFDFIFKSLEGRAAAWDLGFYGRFAVSGILRRPEDLGDRNPDLTWSTYLIFGAFESPAVINHHWHAIGFDWSFPSYSVEGGHCRNLVSSDLLSKPAPTGASHSAVLLRQAPLIVPERVWFSPKSLP